MRRLLAAVTAAACVSGCASQYFRDAGPPPPAPSLTLATLPHKETWAGLVFNGAKIGFSHSRLENLPEGLHRLESEAVMHFRLLGFEKKVHMRAEDVIRDDLTLARFQYRYHMDGSELEVRGEAKEGKLAFELVRGGNPVREEIALRGPVHPSGALALLPVVAGLAPGETREYTVFSGELQKLAEVTQRVEGYERSPLFEGSAFKVTTEMLGLRTMSWIDVQGRPVFELALNGVLISALEDEASAKRYLVSAALNRDEVFLDWSRVPVEREIAEPRAARRLRLAFSGASRDAPSDERQRCLRRAMEIVCDIDAGARPVAGQVERNVSQLSSPTVQSADPSIRSLAQKITQGKSPVEERIAAILAWMDANVKKEAADVFSALDVLDSRRAECQGHAYLYAALARAAGIPTRVANGLVYSSGHKGFLFHAWAESLVDERWQAVDPTFGQAEADATHIALVYGEALSDLVPLVDWVGKLRATVLDSPAP